MSRPASENAPRVAVVFDSHEHLVGNLEISEGSVPGARRLDDFLNMVEDSIGVRPELYPEDDGRLGPLLSNEYVTGYKVTRRGNGVDYVSVEDLYQPSNLTTSE